MPHVSPLRREDLSEHEELFAVFEGFLGFIPNSVLTLARRPAVMDGLRQLLVAIWTTGTVDAEVKSLVALMSSYGAGCRYCQAHTATRSRRAGISSEKLAALADFERSQLFSQAERAALRLAFASGQVPNAASAQHFEELRRHFDDGQIVEIVAVVAAFGFLNRWNETMATDLEELPTRVAATTLHGLAWEPGRHATPGLATPTTA